MKFLYLIIILSLASCSSMMRAPNSLAGKNSTVDENVLSRYRPEILSFQMLVEEALVWRSKSLDFYNKNKDKFEKKNFSHQDLLEIFDSVKNYESIRSRLFQYKNKYGEFISSLEMFDIRPGKGSDLKSALIVVDPRDYEGKEFLLQTKLALDAALVLYDNYLIGIYPYANYLKTRKLINQDIPELHNVLEKLTDNFFDVPQRLAMLKGQYLFIETLKYEKQENKQLEKEEDYLNILALQSPFYQFLLTRKFDMKNQNAIKAYWDRLIDRFTFANDSFTFTASKTFGNTLGLVAFRKGYLTQLSSVEKKQLAQSLKPLDIMMEKTPFRLTDQFIPGHYGHVAIWIGTQKELEDLGLWNHPLIVKYQEVIKSGRHIIEALRPGVQINSLDHFLDIDDLLVVRHNRLSEEQKREYILRAFAQIGKEYDFNFDVETDSKIVCSEIAYVVFHDVDWPTKKQLGRYTISPDNVAQKCLDGVLDPVLMYRDGKKVEGNLIENINEVLKK